MSLLHLLHLISHFKKPEKLGATSMLPRPHLLGITGGKSLMAALNAVSVPQSQVHIQEPSNRLSWSLKAARSVKSTTSKCKRAAAQV